MKRTLAIGDIHGGFKALKQVLERAKVTENDNLIFLGDYMDGWSESSQIIHFLMELSEKQECIFIKGNHDAWTQDWLAFGNAPDVWLFNGGQSTVESYSDYSFEDLETHLEFFEKMRNFFVDEENRRQFLTGDDLPSFFCSRFHAVLRSYDDQRIIADRDAALRFALVIQITRRINKVNLALFPFNWSN